MIGATTPGVSVEFCVTKRQNSTGSSQSCIHFHFFLCYWMEDLSNFHNTFLQTIYFGPKIPTFRSSKKKRNKSNVILVAWQGPRNPVWLKDTMLKTQNGMIHNLMVLWLETRTHLPMLNWPKYLCQIPTNKSLETGNQHLLRVVLSWHYPQSSQGKFPISSHTSAKVRCWIGNTFTGLMFHCILIVKGDLKKTPKHFNSCPWF